MGRSVCECCRGRRCLSFGAAGTPSAIWGMSRTCTRTCTPRVWPIQSTATWYRRLSSSCRSPVLRAVVFWRGG
eukprot:13649504-Alexandrium_andersonii.AAC.1